VLCAQQLEILVEQGGVTRMKRVEPSLSVGVSQTHVRPWRSSVLRSAGPSFLEVLLKHFLHKLGGLHAHIDRAMTHATNDVDGQGDCPLADLRTICSRVRCFDGPNTMAQRR
jgi:hypothetical protein